MSRILKRKFAVAVALILASSSAFSQEGQNIPQDELNTATIYPDGWPSGAGYINVAADLANYSPELNGTYIASLGAGVVMVVDPSITADVNKWENCAHARPNADGSSNHEYVDRCLIINWRGSHDAGIARVIDNIVPGGSYVYSVEAASFYPSALSYSYTKLGESEVTKVTLTEPVSANNSEWPDIYHWQTLEQGFTAPADIDVTKPFQLNVTTAGDELIDTDDKRVLYAAGFSLIGLGEDSTPEPDPDGVVVQGENIPQDELDTATVYPNGWPAGAGYLVDGFDNYAPELADKYMQSALISGDDSGVVMVIDPTVTSDAGKWENCAHAYPNADGSSDHSVDRCLLINWRSGHDQGIARVMDNIVPGASYAYSVEAASFYPSVLSYSYTKLGESTVTKVTLTEPVSANNPDWPDLYHWHTMSAAFKAPTDIDSTKPFQLNVTTAGDELIDTDDKRVLYAANFSLITLAEQLPQDELDTATVYPNGWPAGAGYLVDGFDNYAPELADLYMQSALISGDDSGVVMVIDPTVTADAGKWENCAHAYPNADGSSDHSVDRCLLINWRSGHDQGIARVIDTIVPGENYVYSVEAGSFYPSVLSYSYTKLGESEVTTVTLTEPVSANNPEWPDLYHWQTLGEGFKAPADIDVTKPFQLNVTTVGDELIDTDDKRVLYVANFSLMGPPGDEPVEELPIVQYIPEDELDTATVFPDGWPAGAGYLVDGFDNYAPELADLYMQSALISGDASGVVMVIDPTVTADAGKWENCAHAHPNADGSSDHSVDRCLLINWRSGHDQGIARVIDNIVPGGNYVYSVEAGSFYPSVLSYSYTKLGESTVTTVTLTEPVSANNPEWPDLYHWQTLEQGFTAPADIDVTKPFQLNVTTVGDELIDNDDKRVLYAANFSLMGPGDPDVDSDGDGVSDYEDAFPENDAASVDTDMDGMPDEFLASCDQDCIDNSGLTLDLDDDNDGVSDDVDAFPKNAAASVDTDNDGMPDDFLANCDAGCITASGLTVDSDDDNDGILDEYDTAPLDSSIGDTEPVFGELAIQTIDARGLLTNISAEINVVANDLADGEVMATIVGETSVKSGVNTLQLSATDSAGNIAQAELTVHINPIAELGQQGKVEAGASYRVPVTLSGEAAVYPVTIAYQIIDSAVGVVDGELVIAQGIEGLIDVAVASDAMAGDLVTIMLSSANNAVIVSNDTTMLTVIDMNLAPMVNVSVKQSDNMVSVIDASAGTVTVTATVDDLNSLDTHTINWHVGNSLLVDLSLDDMDSTFEFEPLNAGTFDLSVNVAEDNTIELFAVTADITLVVETELVVLSADNDADNDGISDADEGYADSDQDGILDHLDDDSNPSHLPIGEYTQPMQTVNGLQLSLGDIAHASKGASSIDASIDVNDIAGNAGENGSAVSNAADEHFQALSAIVNFNVSGLSNVGDTVPVVIPLATGKVIPEEAVYRNYIETAGWFDFVVDSKNNVSTALKDADGNCPAPLSFAYHVTIDGLNAGDDCVQLLIEDGGPNDADGQANGIVKDLGVLAIEVQNQAPVITLDDSMSINENSDIVIESIVTDAENDSITYLWEQVSGETVVLADPTSASLAFTSPIFEDEGAELTFILTANDGMAETSKTITLTVVYVNKSPTITISSESSYKEGEKVSITVTASDIEGDDVRYIWTQLSGPTLTLTGQALATSDGSTQTIHFTVPKATTEDSVELQLTVHGGENETTEIITFNIDDSSDSGSMAWLLVFLGLTVFNRRVFKKAA
ncbi:hypothetical protein AADZ86_09030 [Colwelliaceae bacterium BS250]